MATRTAISLSFTILLLYCNILLIHSQSATVTAYCDNWGEILHSTGGSFTLDAERKGDAGSWGTAITATIGVSSSTTIRVKCIDGAHTGGFIAQVTYLGQDYYSTNPLTAGYWRATSAEIAGTSSLSYWLKGSDPWGGCCSLMNDNAYWVWNGQGGDTMTFDLDMGLIVTDSTTTTTTAETTTTAATAEPTTTTTSTTSTATDSSTTSEATTSRTETSSTSTSEQEREQQVMEEHTTDAPGHNEQDNQSEEGLTNKQSLGNLLFEENVVIIVSVLIATFLCLLCLCLCLVLKVWMAQKEENEDIVVQEIEHDTDATNVVVSGEGISVQHGEPQKQHNVVIAPNVVYNANNNANGVQSNVNDVNDDRMKGVSDGNESSSSLYSASSHAKETRGATVDDHVEKEEVEGNDVVSVCTDCGVSKNGKIYDADGMFYCWECWKCYEE